MSVNTKNNNYLTPYVKHAIKMSFVLKCTTVRQFL
jgi:hypothetical protein